MFKKIGIVALVVVAGLFLLNKTDLGSYAGTAWKKIRTSTKGAVPPEFEIERLKNEIAQLVPDMKRNVKVVADEMVAVERLRSEVAETRTELAKKKDYVLAMKSELEKNKNATTVSFRGQEYASTRIKEKLAREWDAYKRGEDGLKSKEQLLVAKEEAVDIAREQLSAMRAKKEQLEVDVARLEAELKTLRLAQTRSNFQLDDSRLARINSAMANVRDQIKSMQIQSDLHGKYVDDLELPAEKRIKTTELIKEIDTHFNAEEGSGVATGNKQ